MQKPFQEIQESSNTNTIINKINFIMNETLKNNDIEIFNHLNKIDVSLHPFGMYVLCRIFVSI
jgi:hypothetical protein